MSTTTITPSAGYGTSKWIVSATLGQGTHTTIAAATASASSGDIIFIRQGTYTENFTAKAGVTYAAFSGSEQTPTVTIVGKITYTDTGTVTFSNIRLETNSDYSLEFTGSNNGNVRLTQCFLNCTNNTGINYTNNNASSVLTINRCLGNLATTGITYFLASSTVGVLHSNLSNGGGSLTANTISAGSLIIINSSTATQYTTSGTAACVILNSRMGNGNATAFTHGGSGVCQCTEASFTSGTASAISIGTGASATIMNCSISSTNTNAITGVGTINACGLCFSDTSTINTTTTNAAKMGVPASFTGGLSGAENLLQLGNSSNTASSAARIKANTAGSTAGDATFEASTTTTSWSFGVDNSVTSPTADPFVISQGTALGTNNIMSAATSGEINYPLQPAFLAIASAQTNVTGDGTQYTVTFTTEVFDQNSDFDGTSTFTSPVTGRYKLQTNITFTGIGAANTTANIIQISTSNRNYSINIGNITATKDIVNNIVGGVQTVLADMDAGDTAIVNVFASGGTKTVGVQATNPTFSGYLAC